MTIRGACLCGGICYEIDGSLGKVDHCHCSKCRRAHGAAFATYADVDPGRFRWTSGEELLAVYESNSGMGWCFCRTCGSTLAASDAGRVTSVTLGTIEGDPGVRPQEHIFVGSKAPWYEITDALPQFSERPPGRQH
jgi:hypothetical protein